MIANFEKTTKEKEDIVAYALTTIAILAIVVLLVGAGIFIGSNYFPAAKSVTEDAGQQLQGGNLVKSLSQATPIQKGERPTEEQLKKSRVVNPTLAKGEKTGKVACVVKLY